MTENRQTPYRTLLRRRMARLWLMLIIGLVVFGMTCLLAFHPEIQAVNNLRDHSDPLIRYLDRILVFLTFWNVVGCIWGIINRVREHRELLQDMNDATDLANPGRHGAN